MSQERPDLQQRFQQLLAAQPQDAALWHELALQIDDSGDSEGAMECWRRAIAAQPNYAEAHNHLGLVLDRLGDSAGAIAAWKEAARLRPDWVEPRYYLSAASEAAPPTTAPARYVAKLFDKYAHDFDRHLLVQLEYKAPQLIAEAIARAGVSRAAEAIDLGCGTGLCGVSLRALAGRMLGVDLSPKMIEKARERNIYDELVAGDLLEVLRNRRGDVDLIVAGDVFVYVGDLSAVFGAAKSALRPQGLLVFTVERTRPDEPDLVLRESRRFSHSRTYIERLVAASGLQLIELTDVILRLDGRDVIEGMLVVVKLKK